jgi:hypothetical protein
MKVISEKWYGEIIFYRVNKSFPEKMITFKFPTREEAEKACREQLQIYISLYMNVISQKLKCDRTLEEDIIG